MTTYKISTEAYDWTGEASSEIEAIAAYVREAGYQTIAQAADVLGKTEEKFIDDCTVSEIAEVRDINGKPIDFDAAVNLMDDDLREELHSAGIESEQAFIEAYAKLHAGRFGEAFAPYAGGAW